MTETSPTTDPVRRTIRPAFLILGALGIALLGAFGGGYWQSYSGSVGSGEKAQIEGVVREYILEHPEILPEAMDRLRAREAKKQLAAVAGDVENPFPGVVLGNPQGKITLVEFSDFACTYCRSSVADVEALIAANPDLRVVIRELPILIPASADAARMGLAAGEQGKYAAFHKAMYAAGRPDAQTIEAAARVAGLDMARARKVAADPKLNAELSRNVAMARQLGFDGTPAWVVGDRIFSGAVGRDALTEAVNSARD